MFEYNKNIATKRNWFPDPNSAMDDGLVSISDEMSVEILKEAYSFGIFPWPHEESPILWFSPDPRGVLDFKDFHIPKSLEKFRKKSGWRFSFDEAFNQVIDECALAPRKEQDGTWITEHMKTYYKKFHQAGYAHSVEVWEGSELVGGMYGVMMGKVFSGESMFFKKSNASKLALVHLVETLIREGFEWMDIQMVTPNVEVFGGKYISRKNFLDRLKI